jgi:hypothetical protein
MWPDNDTQELDDEEYAGDTFQEEEEEAKSTLGEEEEDQGADSQVVSVEIKDSLRLNELLMDILNSNHEGPDESDNESKVSLASTIALGPVWDDGVPEEAVPGILARHGLQAEPQPDKEEQHIAKAKKELSMSVPWQNTSGHHRMF